MADRFNERIESYLADEEPRRPLFAESRTQPPLRNLPKPQQNLSSVSTTLNRSLSDASTASSSSSYRTSNRSSDRHDSTSSTNTTISIPPWHPPTFLQHLVMRRFDYGYDLPCEFLFTDCNLRFDPADYEEWISHSVTHFCGSLPTFAICPFCDDEQATFRSDGDDEMNWRNRMVHIGGHLEERTPFENIRPDYWVIDHLWKHGLISPEDHDHALRGSERPYCANTYPPDYETPDTLRKKERELQVPIDMRAEERRRRNGKAHEQSQSHRQRRFNKPHVEVGKRR